MELRTPYLELLMGRILMQNTALITHAWGGTMQNVFCINPSSYTHYLHGKDLSKSFFFFFFFNFIYYFFMRTNLCNALVVQENSYSIANINLKTIDTVQKIIQRQTTATTTTNT